MPFALPHFLLLPDWNVDVMASTLAAVLVYEAILEDDGGKRQMSKTLMTVYLLIQP